MLTVQVTKEKPHCLEIWYEETLWDGYSHVCSEFWMNRSSFLYLFLKLLGNQKLGIKSQRCLRNFEINPPCEIETAYQSLK